MCPEARPPAGLGRCRDLKRRPRDADAHDVPHRLLVPSIVAACGALALAWTGLIGYVWTDYEFANVEPLRALLAGDWSTFLHRSPVEGPSLLLRAPFAMSVELWGGGDLAVYRMMAVPGLLAGAVLAVVLWEQRVRRFPGARWPLMVVLLAAANPITLRALEMGHPEELLGAALCVGAVLAALAGRVWLAAVLLGLALGNKAWAVLAIGPVLLALDRRRIPALLVAGAVAAVFVAPFTLAGGDAASVVTAAGKTGIAFQPWQVWWFLGDTGHVITGYAGTPKIDYRAAPVWLGTVSHPLIAFLVVPASLAYAWLRRGTRRSPEDVLLLLAALLFARCVLDVANNVYYHLPFVLALLAWEVRRFERPPVLALGAVSLLWVTFHVVPDHVGPDLQSLAYVAWAVPALVALFAAALRGPRTSAAPATAPVTGREPAALPA
jgi:hypothetical protein